MITTSFVWSPRATAMRPWWLAYASFFTLLGVALPRVEEGELAQISPRSSPVMEVLEFVPEAEVDPVYLDASYYVAPERAGEKPYTLL